MDVRKQVEAAPLWVSYNTKIPVIAPNGTRFLLLVSNDLAGRKLVAPKMPNRRNRGAWKLYIDFWETNTVANWLDTLQPVV